jgi:hypothetical protein
MAWPGHARTQDALQSKKKTGFGHDNVLQIHEKAE